MLRILHGRLSVGRLTERDPRGAPDLKWIPTIERPHDVDPRVCPTQALQPGQPTLELGACVFCHACGRNGGVKWGGGVLEPQQTSVPLMAGTTPDSLRSLKARLADLHGIFGRSLGVRLVSVGSCNGCEVEVGALTSPYVDLERFGVKFVASPRHADILLVTGVVTRNLAQALVRTVEAAPQPRAVVAVGACGMTGGIFAGSPHVVGGAHKLVPVDVVVPGCPPPPEALLAGIIEAGRLLSSRRGSMGNGAATSSRS